MKTEQDLPNLMTRKYLSGFQVKCQVFVIEDRDFRHFLNFPPNTDVMLLIQGLTFTQPNEHK